MASRREVQGSIDSDADGHMHVVPLNTCLQTRRHRYAARDACSDRKRAKEKLFFRRSALELARARRRRINS